MSVDDNNDIDEHILPVYVVPGGRFKTTIILPCNYRYESNGTVNL